MAVTGPWLLEMMTDWLAGKTVMAMLATSAYVPDPDSSTVPTAQEASGAGYTAGGVDVTALLNLVYDATTDSLRLHCADMEFGTVTLPSVGAVVVYVGALAIAVDAFAPVEVSSRPFTYRPASDGLVVAGIETGV